MLYWIAWNRTVYLYIMDLALNNLQGLICHKTQTNKQITTPDQSGPESNGNEGTFHTPQILTIRCSLILYPECPFGGDLTSLRVIQSADFKLRRQDCQDCNDTCNHFSLNFRPLNSAICLHYNYEFRDIWRYFHYFIITIREREERYFKNKCSLKYTDMKTEDNVIKVAKITTYHGE